MKKITLIAGVVLAITLACKKDKTTTAPATTTTTTTPTATTPPTTITGFVWSEDGGANITADSAHFTNQYKTLIAYKAGQTKFEINLNGTTPATYTVDTTGANALTFVANNAYSTAKSGTVKITANAAAKISGNFNVVMKAGAPASLKGTFTDVVIK